MSQDCRCLNVDHRELQGKLPGVLAALVLRHAGRGAVLEEQRVHEAEAADHHAGVDLRTGLNLDMKMAKLIGLIYAKNTRIMSKESLNGWWSTV